jgi:hypothetical protein
MDLPYPVKEKPVRFIRAGEWNNEPDIHTWWYHVEQQSFSCAIIRNQQLGHLCGYVKLPEGCVISPDALMSFSVHGGITYDDDGWIGFDCAHSQDFCPADVRRYSQCTDTSYRNFYYVKTEVRRLCQQVEAYLAAQPNETVPKLTFWLGADAENV